MVITIIITLSCFFFVPTIRGETLEEKKNQTQEKREQAEQKLEYVTNEIGSSLVRVQEIDDKIRAAEAEIAKMSTQLADLQKQVDETQANLNEVQEKYKNNRNLMETRLVAMYESGDITYLDLLLHSTSLIEFLSNYYMINEIADEHCVTIKDDTAKFAGVLASGIGAYWVGTTIINKILAAIIGVIIPIYGFFIAAPVLNVFLNGYFTWSVGKKADAIFSDYSNEKAGAEIATLIIKAVCHIPDASEIRDFLNEGGLTIKEIKNMLD